ncbi:hypothetical protein KEJ44_09150 [Candidatus Bathyarchaeota archaeon]|nr:hypothetical protein [Candidatus Bathyarchaeota archaeon]
MDWFKRLLAFSAIALALLALITMFVPLSSRIYTVEEARLYPITVTTTSSTTLIKVEYKTYTSISTSTIEFGSSSENFASKDLSECPPILEAKLYVDLKRGIRSVLMGI